jgi:hypothetical protein
VARSAKVGSRQSQRNDAPRYAIRFTHSARVAFELDVAAIAAALSEAAHETLYMEANRYGR